MKWLVLAGLSLVFIPLHVQAMPTAVLFENCSSTKEDEDGAAALTSCLTYLRGYLDYVNVASSLEPNSDQLVCLPVNVGLEQVRLMFLKFMEARPEILHLDSAFILRKVLVDGFSVCGARPSLESFEN